MELTINYFGMLTDITSCAEEKIDFNGGTTADLLSILYLKYPQLKSTSFKTAQNQTITTEDEIITSNTIVLLPPFSGG